MLIAYIVKKCRESRRQTGVESPTEMKRTSRQFSEEGVVIDFYRNLGLDPVIKKSAKKTQPVIPGENDDD